MGRGSRSGARTAGQSPRAPDQRAVHAREADVGRYDHRVARRVRVPDVGPRRRAVRRDRVAHRTRRRPVGDDRCLRAAPRCEGPVSRAGLRVCRARRRVRRSVGPARRRARAGVPRGPERARRRGADAAPACRCATVRPRAAPSPAAADSDASTDRRAARHAHREASTHSGTEARACSSADAASEASTCSAAEARARSVAQAEREASAGSGLEANSEARSRGGTEAQRQARARSGAETQREARTREGGNASQGKAREGENHHARTPDLIGSEKNKRRGPEDAEGAEEGWPCGPTRPLRPLRSLLLCVSPARRAATRPDERCGSGLALRPTTFRRSTPRAPRSRQEHQGQ